MPEPEKQGGWIQRGLEKALESVVLKIVLAVVVLGPYVIGGYLWTQQQTKASKKAVEKKADSKLINQRLKRLEEAVQRLDTSDREDQRVIDRLDWWLDTQREMREAPDSLKNSRWVEEHSP